MDDDRSPAFDRPRGLGLRGKLGLGFTGLVALLVAVGMEGVSLLTGLGGSIDVILRENYKSVLACERMKESLERMDSGALFVLAGEPAEGRALAAEHRPRFEEALRVERGNVTLPGEGERVERLQALFATYLPILDRLLAPQTPETERRGLYFDRLYPTFREIKSTADEILAMNQAAMEEADARSRALSASSSRRMALLLLATTAFAGLLAALLLRAVLGPLRKLTAATGRIAAGDLDHLVPVTSGDELGRLAASFNAMAAGLRDLRVTEEVRLLRTRRVGDLRAALLANAARDLGRALGPLREILDGLAATDLANRRLAEAQEAVGGVERLADHLLTTSRLEDRRQRLHLEEVLPADLVEAATRAVRSAQRRQSRGELTIEVDPAAAPVLVDRAQAERALSSLLRHVLDRSPEGGTVAVRVKPGDGRTRFFLRATQAQDAAVVPDGETPATLGRIAGPAPEIVETHGGEIACPREDGTRFTVRFTLPTAPIGGSTWTSSTSP